MGTREENQDGADRNSKKPQESLNDLMSPCLCQEMSQP